jgi:exonuclease III
VVPFSCHCGSIILNGRLTNQIANSHGFKYIEENERGQGEGLRLYSLNVCGLRDKNKRNKLFTFLRGKPHGIILLQETFSIKGDEKVWAREWEGDIFMSHGTQHSKGTAILIAKDISYTLENTITDENGRYVYIEGIFKGHPLTILNYYAPTREKVSEQIAKLDEILPLITEQAHKIIWAGDFNNCITEHDNFGNQSNIRNNAAIKLNNIMQEEGMCDIWRIFNEDKKRATWRRSTYKGIQQSRIDFFIIPTGMIYNVKSCEIDYGLYTDHSLISLEIKAETEDIAGRGLWKFNNSLLNDAEYIKRIQGVIKECEEKYKKLSSSIVQNDLIACCAFSLLIKYLVFFSLHSMCIQRDLICLPLFIS